MIQLYKKELLIKIINFSILQIFLLQVEKIAYDGLNQQLMRSFLLLIISQVNVEHHEPVLEFNT